MPHPTLTKRKSGKLWHLEDEHLSKRDAEALKKHLIKTEDKHAKVVKGSNGYEVWWWY